MLYLLVVCGFIFGRPDHNTAHAARQPVGRSRRMEPCARPRRPLIIDCHGHYTTAPKALEAWRNRQIAGIQDPASMPKVSDLKISDDELRESIETNQLRLMKERGSDITIFSPRASFMAHHIGDFNVSSAPGRRSATSCASGSRQLFPDHFIGRGHAAAVAWRRPGHLHPRAGEVRQGIRRRGHQPEPGPERAATGPRRR
jgi:hypothetical protein